jgi:hypothetical protein
VLGGSDGDTFHSNMLCRVGFIPKGQSLQTDHAFVAMIFQGSATANGIPVKAGDLIEGESLNLIMHENVGLVLINNQSTTAEKQSI